MVRVKNWLNRHKRHREFVKAAKWFRLGRNNVYKQVRLALVKQWQHAYEWRKEKKRDFRKLWIERISAALRSKWMKYSVFFNLVTQKDVQINRKVLSNIAVVFPNVFDKICEYVVSAEGTTKVEKKVTRKKTVKSDDTQSA